MPHTLAYDVCKHFTMSSFTDFSFKFKNYDKKGTDIELNVHRFILAAWSSVFLEMIKSAKSNSLIVNDFSYHAYKCLITYLYLDDIKIIEKQKSASFLIEVLKLCKKHKLNEFMNHCEIQFKKIIKEEINIPALNFSQEKKFEDAEEGFE